MIQTLFGAITPYENSDKPSEDLMNAKTALSQAKEKTAFILKEINGIRVALTGKHLMDEFTRVEKI